MNLLPYQEKKSMLKKKQIVKGSYKRIVLKSVEN